MKMLNSYEVTHTWENVDNQMINVKMLNSNYFNLKLTPNKLI